MIRVVAVVARALVPALIAALAVRALGFSLVDRRGLFVGVGLYFLFRVLATYWRFRMPSWLGGARPHAGFGASDDDDTLPEWERITSTRERLESPRAQRHLRRSLDAPAKAVLQRALTQLRDARILGDRDGARSALATARSVAAPTLRYLDTRAAIEIALTVAAAAGVALLGRAAFHAYRVDGDSMLPTFERGDGVIGAAFAIERAADGANEGSLRRGDVIVFRGSAVYGDRTAASQPAEWMKRVIGLPGDRIAMRGASPIINGWPVPSCDAGEYAYVMRDGSGSTAHGRLHVEFLGDRAYLTVRAPGPPMEGEYVVKPGEVFVLGDNRGNSTDSRVFLRDAEGGARGGGVPFAAIEGRVARFLVGARRAGDDDWSRFLRPVDALERELRVEGVDVRVLERGVARCLSARPPMTDPPR